jgi:hypothetical protein
VSSNLGIITEPPNKKEKNDKFKKLTVRHIIYISKNTTQSIDLKNHLTKNI